MRITNNMLISNIMNSITKNASRMAIYQTQLSTGKKFIVPSDDPITAARALKFRTDVAEIQQFNRNAYDAKAWMDLTDTQLNNFGQVLQRTRELVVQGANETLTETDKQKMLNEISQLKNQLVEIANSTYEGRYLFAGFETDTMPVTVEKVQVSEGVYTDVLKYNGRYINLGGAVHIGGTDITDFYNENKHMIDGRPILRGGNIQADYPLNITNGVNDSFNFTLGTISETITITDGIYNNVEDLSAELQARLDDEFGLGSLRIIFDEDKNRIAFISMTDESITINEHAGNTGISLLGFRDGYSAVANQQQSIQYRLGIANSVKINVEANEILGGMSQMFNVFNKIEMALQSETHYRVINEDGTDDIIELSLSNLIEELDLAHENLLGIRADIGARSNYVDMTINRLDSEEISFLRLMSENEDVDIAEVIMKLTNEENVYRSALAAGARVIMPTLVDFLR